MSWGLILAVLAAVAVPLYLNTRKTSAARACKANINAIASAESAYALRNGKYIDQSTLATTSPEGLAATAVCPLDHSAYEIGTSSGATDVTSAGTTSKIWIVCPNATTHSGGLSGSAVTDWQYTMAAIGSDANP